MSHLNVRRLSNASFTRPRRLSNVSYLPISGAADAAVCKYSVH